MDKQKDRALKKLDIEIDKGVEILIAETKKTTLSELLYWFFLLHLNRVIGISMDLLPQGISENAIKKTSALSDETIKYLIQLNVKYGRKFLPGINDTLIYNKGSIEYLFKNGNLLNTKYDMRSMIGLFDVSVHGNRDKYVKVDMSAVKTDPDIKKFFDYFVRIDKDNFNKVLSKKNYVQLLDDFKNEYLEHDDLFQKTFKISLRKFIKLYTFLLETIKDKWTKVESSLPRMDNGNVDVLGPNAFESFSDAFIFDVESIKLHFGKAAIDVIHQFTFQPEEYDERELRFHRVTRCPFIKVADDLLMVSPELLLDSLFLNIHFCFLEGPKDIKEEYKKRCSEKFINEIAMAASKVNFVEVNRGVDLYEGKRTLGDIDIVLKNDKDEFLLIEAKNHALPLNVYFKDIEEVNKHLITLREEWEKKVLARYAHIGKFREEYGIGSNYKYIVVSRFPEIISHYSDLVVLSFYEFVNYISDGFNKMDFNDVYARLYSFDSELTERDMILLQEEGHYLMSKLLIG